MILTIPTQLKRILLTALVALLPALLTIVFLRTILQTDLTQFVPHAQNDQLLYWHSILSFSQYGFNAGYYVPNELAAPAAFTHFGSVGPMFPVIYGTLAHFTGWQTYTGILFNMVLLGAAFAFFIYYTKLDLRQITVMVLFVATFWPILFYVPSIFQESLHYAAAVVFAALFYPVISQRGNTSFSLKAVLWFLIGVMALVRLSWGLLFVPFFLLTTDPKTIFRYFLALVQAAVCLFLVVVISRYITSPTNNSVFAGFNSFQGSLLTGLSHILNQTMANLRASWQAFSGLNVYAITIWQIVIFVLLTVFSVRLFRRARNQDAVTIKRETLFHLVNMGGIIAASLALYLTGGYYRVLSAHFLISLLLLIVLRKFRFVLFVTAFNLIAFPLFTTLYQVEWKYNFSVDTDPLHELRSTLESTLVYDSDISNAWCNTVLMNIALYDSRLIAVPAGIGTSFILDWGVQPPLKSKYFLMDDYTYLQYAEKMPLQLLTTTAFGDVYLNLEADCYDDLLVYIARNRTPVYVPLDYFNSPTIARQQRGLNSFPNVKVYSGQPLPSAPVIFPHGIDVTPTQYAFLQPDNGEILILPPLSSDSATGLAEEVLDAGEVIANQQGWELGTRLNSSTDHFANLSPASKSEVLAVFDDTLELVGVEMLREMQPGKWSPVTLYWRLRNATSKAYFAYVQVLDFNGNKRSESQPDSEGLFNTVYPTSLWQVGEVIPETRSVKLYDDAPEGGYRLVVSVFTQPEQQLLAAVDVHGESLGQWVRGARPVVPMKFPEPQDAAVVDARLGDSIRLSHYQTEPAVGDLKAGTTLNLTLVWEALAVPADDYTIFAHVRDAAGNTVTQQDAPPLDGRYPTGNWGTGEQVVTTHVLSIPTDAKPPFTVVIGMYTWPDLERLPVIQGGVSIPENLVTLP